VNTRFLSRRCPRCLESRLFRLVVRAERKRMICSECELDLPAADGPVTDWRELLEGARVGEPPDDGRRPPV
jgi:hypothetical protein